jgi:MFS family permease
MSAEGSTSPAVPSSGRAVAAPGARLALTLLLVINLLNYMDRYILSAVLPKIEKQFFNDSIDEKTGKKDELVEAKMGSLSTAFLISYMLIAPIFGVLADRVNRWWLIGIGVAVWSFASGASGLALTFLMLLVTRIFVGVGEGAYGPAAPAVISDMYPVSRRGQVLAWFYVAIPVGSALGYVLGGQMLNVSAWFTGEEKWQWAFYMVVPPGLLLAAICFFMREPPRGLSDSGAIPHKATWADYKIILQTPSFIYVTLGYTALTFVQGGIAYWMPRYVNINRGVENLAQVNSVFGGILVLSGLLSTLAGGWTGDKLRDRLPGAYLLVSGWGVLLAFPLMLAVIYVDFPYAWIFVFLAVCGMFFNTGPINTVMANVTHPSVRASAFAINILVIHLFGDAVSPSIMGLLASLGRYLSAEGRTTGWLAGALGQRDGMDFSFAFTSLFLLLAGALWLWGARYLERDTALAPQRIARPKVA